MEMQVTTEKLLAKIGTLVLINEQLEAEIAGLKATIEAVSTGVNPIVTGRLDISPDIFTRLKDDQDG